MSQVSPAQYENFEPVIIQEKFTKKSGEIIIRNYVRGKFLSRGSSGTCFEITDLKKNKVLAVKIIPQASLNRNRSLERLRGEIKIHKSLDHPHIVRFEHVFEDKDNIYILLEPCLNQTLKGLLEKQKRLPEAQCATYLIQAIHALKYLHSKNIIHRHIKLGSLVLGKSSELKLNDFALSAKIEQDGQRRRTVCGTPNYIAPEVLNKSIGHSYEVDVWSLGVVFYTLLIGRPPFETPDIKTTYKRIMNLEYSFPTHIQISENAKDLITKILVVEPSKRPTLDEILEHPFFNPDVHSTNVNEVAPVKSKESTLQPTFETVSSPVEAQEDRNHEKVADDHDGPRTHEGGVHKNIRPGQEDIDSQKPSSNLDKGGEAE